MIRYKSTKQLSIEEFKTPFQINLDKENRWVKLTNSLPWDALADIYYQSMSSDRGAPAIDARIVIGALIVKHKLSLDDRETIETIRENMYIQYFLGLEAYTYNDVFDRSLFTLLRYRLGADKFDAMTGEIILMSEGKHGPDEKKAGGAKAANRSRRKSSAAEKKPEEKPKGNKGVMIVDATVADQMVAYPTDLGLVARSRQESERIIDRLCKVVGVKDKPRTYRRLARKQYLNLSKKKNKSKSELRRAIGKQLRYLRRNLGSIEGLLDRHQGSGFPLSRRDQRIYWVIQHIFDQQQKMYKDHTHSVENRIVNIYQPYVRPIVRGKDKANV